MSDALHVRVRAAENFPAKVADATDDLASKCHVVADALALRLDRRAHPVACRLLGTLAGGDDALDGVIEDTPLPTFHALNHRGCGHVNEVPLFSRQPVRRTLAGS